MPLPAAAVVACVGPAITAALGTSVLSVQPDVVHLPRLDGLSMELNVRLSCPAANSVQKTLRGNMACAIAATVGPSRMVATLRVNHARLVLPASRENVCSVPTGQKLARRSLHVCPVDLATRVCRGCAFHV